MPKANHGDARKAVHALLQNVFDLLCVGHELITLIDENMRIKHGNVSIYAIPRDPDVPDDSDILSAVRGGTNLSFIVMSPDELGGLVDRAIHNSLITSRHLCTHEPYVGLQVTWALD
jgi:hypothetical protein